MIVAIATDGKYVSPHFGRCQAYTIADIADGYVVRKETVANPGHAPGAIPEFLNKKGAKKVVCGGIGTRAKDLFGQYGIEILAGVSGTVDSAIDKLAGGTLSGGESFCKPGAGRGHGVEKTECDHAHEKS
jgi:predicted Fe-Mo cluster-binding NifX family protein